MTSSLTCRLVWLGLSVVLLCPPPINAASDPLETIGKAATEWVKLRTETTRVESEWLAQRQVLESTVTALEQRARDLEGKRDNLKAKTATDRDELSLIDAKNVAASDAITVMESRLLEMKDRLLQLRPSLPPRLSAALDLPYRSLTGLDLPAGERLQLTMTILNRCMQFNRMISCGEEMIIIDGELAPRSLEVIYWGLSHGYCLDRKSNQAWIGSPAPQGWHWEAKPEAAKAVSRLIAVYNGTTDPEFVAVPAQVALTASEILKN